MVIGVLQFELLIHGSESLKDKRRVVRSVKDRLHREHMVSVAEVGTLDAPGTATMALACVGTDGARVGEVLDRITSKLRALIDAELGEVSRQVLRGADVAVRRADLDDASLAREILEHYERPEETA
jgi:uncharacterized protein YlxP (DUF503 family)